MWNNGVSVCSSRTVALLGFCLGTFSFLAFQAPYIQSIQKPNQPSLVRQCSQWQNSKAEESLGATMCKEASNGLKNPGVDGLKLHLHQVKRHRLGY